MKKIIFLTYSLAVGGAERRTCTISNFLVDKGVDVDIVLLDSPKVNFDLDKRVKVYCFGDEERIIHNEKADVIQLKAEPFKVKLFNRIKLRVYRRFNKRKFKEFNLFLYLYNKYVTGIRQYVREKPDAVVVSWMSYCNVSASFALKDLPNKYAFSECMSPEAEFPAGHPMNALKRKYYPRADAAFFQTFDESDYYTYLPNTEKYVIPNPVLGSFPERYEGVRKKTVVNFCRLSKAKNIPLLIDAFALFFKEFPDYKLIIYGEGSEKDSIVDYAEKKGIKQSFEIRPFDVNVHSLISDAGMFVSSSDREGISNSMLEAMAIGLPCICTDCPAGGARMVIKDSENGLIVPMRDAGAMSAAMIRIAENKDFSDYLSKNATEIKYTLSASSICQKWYDALSEMSDSQ